jgi:hypothetical protein
MATKKRKAVTTKKQNKIEAKTEKVSLEHWLGAIKSSHEQALAAAVSPSGCCQVQNQQTGGVFKIPTDAATCQAMGGVFTAGPC